jgi:hypothetical protein
MTFILLVLSPAHLKKVQLSGYNCLLPLFAPSCYGRSVPLCSTWEFNLYRNFDEGCESAPLFMAKRWCRDTGSAKSGY